MKCSRCGDYKETVGDVRRCGGCADGTTQAIPAHLSDEAPLTTAVAANEGLGNRFKPGSLPPEDGAQPVAYIGDAAGLVADKPKEGIIAKVKRAARRAVGKK